MMVQAMAVALGMERSGGIQELLEDMINNLVIDLRGG